MKLNFNFKIVPLLMLGALFNGNCLSQSFTADILVSYDDVLQCEGSAVHMDAFPSDNSLYTYSWTCPGGVCPPSWSQNDAFASFTPDFGQPVTGNYSVLITEIATGDTASATATISTYPNPSASYDLPSYGGCEGTQVYIHTDNNNPAYGPYSYVWDNGSPTTSDSILYTFTASFGFAPNVQVTNVYGCSAINQTTLWMFGSPTPVVTVSATSPVAFCAGGNVLLDADVSHPVYSFNTVSYHWKKYNYFLNSYDTSLLVTTTGRYRVVATGDGCSTTSNFIDVTARPRPAVTVNPTGPIGVCFSPINITANAPTAISYSWKKNSNVITNSNNDTLSVVKGGWYKVTVADQYGCTRTSAPVVIEGPPSKQITASGPLTFCAGDSVVLTAAPGYTYQWRNNNNDIIGETNQSFTAYTTGNYKAMVTNSFNCTAATFPMYVNVNCRISADEQYASDFNVFPNPFLTELNVVMPPGAETISHLSLYDYSGRLVFTAREADLNEGKLNFIPGNINSGTYLLRIISGESEFKKIIVKQ